MGNNIYQTMTWARAEKLLQGRCYGSRRLANNTYLEREEVGEDGRREDIFHIRFHRTRILSFYPDDSMSVQVGRWQTLTTKDRLNVYSGLNFYSDKGQWYIRSYGARTGSLDRVFEDGMVKLAFGELVGPDRKTPLAEDPRPAARLRRKVATYASQFAGALEIWKPDMLPTGDLKAGLQDCLSCQLSVVENGDPIRAIGRGGTADNIKEHMTDLQFVASWLPPATGYGWWDLVGDGRGMKARRKKAAGMLRDWLVDRIEQLEDHQTLASQPAGVLRKITVIDATTRTITYDDAGQPSNVTYEEEE